MTNVASRHSALLFPLVLPRNGFPPDKNAMHFLTALGALLTSLVVATNVGAQLQELTPANFKDSTSNGLWFIEYFSPRCPHCRKFAPTWEKLVQECETEIPSVHLAQVNCAMYGGAWLSSLF
jgi:thioredoxin domain-containing protein 5